MMEKLKHTYVDIANYTVVFQFHDGTIKTLHTLLVSTFFCYFNSMMVQLKQDYPTYPDQDS